MLKALLRQFVAQFVIMRYVQYMRPHILQHIYRRLGGDVENIDVHDLPEEEARMVAAFVEFLRRRRSQQLDGEQEPQEIREASPGQTPAETVFAAWPLGVKGLLTREEIYDHL
jgi:hypothetical protein